MTKICLVCGKEYQPTNPVKPDSQKYCSVECRRMAHLKRKCQVCGKEIIMKPNQKFSLAKYCSVECRRKAKPIKICERCGKKFRAYHFKDKYCSVCTALTYTIYQCKCLHCGKIFEGTHKNAKYCSEDCHSDHGNKKPYKKNYVKTCENCGKEFQAWRTTDKYCSKKCRLDFYRSRRKKFLADRVCIMCGKIFTPKYHRQECCSEECSKENKLVREETRDIKMRHCSICGKEFISIRGKKTCSAECTKKIIARHFIEENFFDEIDNSGKNN